MAYARTYDVSHRFGENKLNQTRKLFLSELEGVLSRRHLDPSKDITSVFDVGCSLGYLLRHVETGLFSGAARLAGIDIDAHAVRQGQHHLQALKSKVTVQAADMEDLPNVLRSNHYDVFFCTGVLMYLEEVKAANVVKVILDHTDVVAGFAGLADPEIDNAQLESSRVRSEDGSLIHNIDRMVEGAGGHVIHRRWDGGRSIDGNTIYFVFAERKK